MLQFTHFQVNSKVFKEIESKCLFYANKMYGGASKIKVGGREYKLGVSFDNGWRKVSQG